MDCVAILEILSEYLDGTLDAQTRKVVEKHISVCENCKQEFASILAVVEELGAMEPVKPPEDFLEKIRERMETRSGINKIFRKLFVPFHIKIPLELAAAATVTILVVLVLNIQQTEIQMMKPLTGTTSQSMGQNLKKDLLKPALKKQAEPPATVLEETPPKLSDNRPVRLTRRSGIKTDMPLIQKKNFKKTIASLRISSSFLLLLLLFLPTCFSWLSLHVSRLQRLFACIALLQCFLLAYPVL